MKNLLAVIILSIVVHAADTEKVLHNFQNTWDGSYPVTGMIADAAANMYGTTHSTVFETVLQPNGSWKMKTLHRFTGADGYDLRGDLVFDPKGNLFGTTHTGNQYHHDGTVFELSPQVDGTWKRTTIITFNNRNGNKPMSGMIFDAAGNLYGSSGGKVYELSPGAHGQWVETVLWLGPGVGGQGSLVFDAQGNLYGTYPYGGNNFGFVFELSPGTNGHWTPTVLYSFCPAPPGCLDGSNPLAGLVVDSAGNLYGTTEFGGTYNNGTVFEISSGAETVLHSFQKAVDGAYPQEGALIFDAQGNLYGTTPWGVDDGSTQGAVFELSPVGDGTWTETVLHIFLGSPKDGGAPFGRLLQDSKGILYGTTDAGGNNKQFGFGTIFKVQP